MESGFQGAELGVHGVESLSGIWSPRSAIRNPGCEIRNLKTSWITSHGAEQINMVCERKYQISIFDARVEGHVKRCQTSFVHYNL